MIGVDTGFFFALREGLPIALRAFEQDDILMSVLTRFELKRWALRRGLPWDKLAGWLTRSIATVGLTDEAAEEAAALSHGTGIPAMDALILASLLAAGCRTIYTRDDHLLRVTRKDIEVIRI